MPTLALSMIVKNGASDLPECLASVAGVVDEIVIADTGSSDGSLELAAKLGAKALPVVWEDDYAKARNLSLAQVTADWVLTLDADERLDPEAGAKIPALIANPSAAGYQVTIRNYVADAGKKVWDRPSHPNDGSYGPARQYPAYIDHENVRLFRREPEIYFTGCVHETVGWRIAETGGKVGAANFLIHHFGMVRGEETLRRKILFYRELGLKKIVDSPENAQAHFEVGIVEMENLGDVSGALPYFERACELNPKLGVAWFFAAKALFAQSQFARALRALQSAERAGHAKAAVAELAGDAHYNLGDHPAAAESYRRALKREPQSASIESKLGLAEARTGNASQGLHKLRHAIARSPGSSELHDRLVTVEVWLGRLPEAAEDAERKLDALPARPEDFLRAASIRAKLEQWDRAASLLRRGLAIHPDAEALKANLCKIETLLVSSADVSAERVTNCAGED